MADDQHILWTTKQKQAMVKDEDYVDPYSLYNFFSTSGTTKAYLRWDRMRVRSAAPRINGRNPSSDTSSVKNALGIQLTLQNPSPTPATSRPLSARSVRSTFSSAATSGKGVPSIKLHSCPTLLYLGFHKARCKSAPPRPADYYLPQRPRTARTKGRSANSSVRSAPQRAWQTRTSSNKDCHSLLSPDKVTKRHKGRCKSAPLPYDFSSIELVASVPNHSSESQKLKALTRPLTCTPEVVQNVLSSNSLRHCCSAYYPRPKTSPTMRQQFWPVSRPTVFQRGSVPKYLHFVKPAGIWLRDGDDQLTCPFDNDMPEIEEPNMGTNISTQGSDEVEETLLYEEQFWEPASLSEADTDQENWPELEVDPAEVNTEGVFDKILPEDLASKLLIDGENIEKPSSKSKAQKLYHSEEEKSDNRTPHSDEGFKITITKVEHLPAQDPLTTPEQQREPRDEKPSEQDVTSEGVVPKPPQLFTAESSKEGNKGHKNDEPLQQGLETEASLEPVLEGPLEPTTSLVKDNEQKLSEKPTPKQSDVKASDSQVPQVKFSEVFILTSFKPPDHEVKEEKKEVPVKPILKPTVKKQDALLSVHEKPRLLQNEFTKRTEPTPLKPKPQPAVLAEKNPVQEEKKAEEKINKAAKLEPEVLPQPEYIRARGAYRMYDPKDLLHYQLEQQRDTRPDRKSVPAASMPHFVPSAESTTLITSIMDNQKRMKEGTKPWLQGRLALSRQTSRFELPMDVRLLEEMTPLEYLTKYCIISTRRKALYKHIFQKVDRDRDNLITFKEMDRGLKDIHADYINTEKVKKLIEMVEGNEKSTFNLKQFSAIAAFSERLLFSESKVNEKDSVYSAKEIIEEADFCGLKSKLNGFRIKPTVRKILEVL